MKWADYLISEVRFNDEETHIVKVKVHPDNGDKVGSWTEWTRQEVISSIDAGYTFATIYKGSNGNWNLGAHIITITIEGVRYIKTQADTTKKDNLDNLPRY